MSLLSDSISQLAGNILGGSDVSSLLRKSSVELRDNSPTSTLAGDPFKFSSISYPRDVTYDMANGHYMLFYVNVQNKTKYKYEAQDGLPIGDDIITYKQGQAQVADRNSGSNEASYRRGLINRGGKGNVLDSNGVDLRKQKTPRTGINSVLPTTTRITDSVAIYLPPNVQDVVSAVLNALKIKNDEKTSKSLSPLLKNVNKMIKILILDVYLFRIVTHRVLIFSLKTWNNCCPLFNVIDCLD